MSRRHFDADPWAYLRVLPIERPAERRLSMREMPGGAPLDRVGPRMYPTVDGSWAGEWDRAARRRERRAKREARKHSNPTGHAARSSGDEPSSLAAARRTLRAWGVRLWREVQAIMRGRLAALFLIAWFLVVMFVAGTVGPR